jgi:hypothetical protein
MASRESLFIGIDVSKQTLDAAFGADPHAPRETIPSTDEGVQLLVTRLQRLQPTLIVLEATGGLERMVFAQLLQAGVPTRGCSHAACAPWRTRKDARRRPTAWMPGCSPALPNGCARRTTKRRTSSAHPCATCWSGGSSDSDADG